MLFRGFYSINLNKLLKLKNNEIFYSRASLTTETNENNKTDVIRRTIPIKNVPAPIRVKFVLRRPTSK